MYGKATNNYKSPLYTCCSQIQIYVLDRRTEGLKDWRTEGSVAHRAFAGQLWTSLGPTNGHWRSQKRCLVSVWSLWSPEASLPCWAKFEARHRKFHTLVQCAKRPEDLVSHSSRRLSSLIKKIKHLIGTWAYISTGRNKRPFSLWHLKFFAVQEIQFLLFGQKSRAHFFLIIVIREIVGMEKFDSWIFINIFSMVWNRK